MIEYVLFCFMIPRIVPVSIRTSRMYIQSWMKEAMLREDTLRISQISDAHYNLQPSENIATIAMTIDDEYTAFALMERILPNQVHVWSIDSNDHYSGSLLAKHFSRYNNITLSACIDDRWKVAACYYTS